MRFLIFLMALLSATAGPASAKEVLSLKQLDAVTASGGGLTIDQSPATDVGATSSLEEGPLVIPDDELDRHTGGGYTPAILGPKYLGLGKDGVLNLALICRKGCGGSGGGKAAVVRLPNNIRGSTYKLR